MPTLQSLQDGGFHDAPAGSGHERRLGVTPDRIQSHGLDLSEALTPARTGLVWAAVREGRGDPAGPPRRSTTSKPRRARRSCR